MNGIQRLVLIAGMIGIGASGPAPALDLLRKVFGAR